MKSILLSLMLSLMMLSSIPSQSYAENWDNIGANEKAVIYIDTDSIVKSEPLAGVRVKVDYLNKEEGIDYSIGFMEFNCKEKIVRLQSAKAWDTSGNITNLTVDPLWHQVQVDNHLMIFIMKTVCDGHPVK